MSDKPVITTRALTRYFGRKAAVYELNLEVPRGGIFAFLGRNGSGKTTLIRMLLGLLDPTRGEASILGCNIRAITPEIRARIGYLTEEHQLYTWMTVQQCEAFQKPFYPHWDGKIFREVVDHFGLQEQARVKHLSRGERAGLSLALTLAPDPELLVLDDPAIGLDPVARRALLESLILLTRRPDRTIFFSSHELADVERVADNFAVLDNSVLRAACSLETFRNSVRQVRVRFGGSPPRLPDIPGVLQIIRSETDLRLICVHYNDSTQQALRAAGAIDIQTDSVALEDALISYLGRRGEKFSILSETATRS